MSLQGSSSGKQPPLVRHKRSKSFPNSEGCSQDPQVQSEEPADSSKLCVPGFDVSSCIKKFPSNAHQSLGHEILQLEKRLGNQVSVRCALEKALGYKASSSKDMITEASIPKSATELIKEIAVMEVEVGHLEQYLLSLYRKAFDQQLTSKKDEAHEPPVETPMRKPLDSSASRDSKSHARSTKSMLPRSQSSRLQRKTPLACHSQPLSMMECVENSSANAVSLAEHLGSCVSPNKLSEDMVKCICNIYFKLADPRHENHPSSPTSSFSSLGVYSPKYQCDSCSPGFRNDSSFDAVLDNPFHVQGLKDFSGPYSTMIEINWIYRDNKTLADVECLVENFRSLISRLEGVDLKRMTHEEKLAFWINVHNALVMHSFLAFGIPKNKMRRMFLLMKAAYIVGGQVVSADLIQTVILGCRLSRPGQWMRALLPSKSKFKAVGIKQAFAIDRPEPLIYFALSSGSHSDPAVRVYDPKRVFQELESAKEDYIRATFGVGKDHRILLPKIIECFAKDSGLCQGGIVKMMHQTLPHTLKKRHQTGKVQFVPHNFAFRYLISKELVK